MYRLALGLREDRYAALLNRHGRDLLDMAYFLDYGSLGFRQRAEHDSVLSYDLFARAETDAQVSRIAINTAPGTSRR